MDNTRELEFDRIRDAAAYEGQDEERLQRLTAACESLFVTGGPLVDLANKALEELLVSLNFDRGLFLSVAVGAAGEFDEGADIIPLASRDGRRSARGHQWGDVINPEFCINRSVISRAVATARLLVIEDCLLHPRPDVADRDGPDDPDAPHHPNGPDQHRTVVCIAFALTGRERGVLYIDRELGRGDVREIDLQLFKEFVTRAVPLVARSYAVEELERIRGKLRRNEIRPIDDDSDDLDDSEESEESTNVGEIPTTFGIVGNDEQIQKIFRIINKIKDGDLNVCIVGESGTGKEMFARAIHAAGARREQQFVAENCGALSETLLESELFGHVKGAFTGADENRRGLFELADGGTLFLDEIGDMSESMQKKLLRVLQEGLIRPIGSKDSISVDVRVICASNRDLKLLVQKGEFRADLYYRLNVITLNVPPLRERPDDTRYLVAHFAAEVCREEGINRRFSSSAMRALCEYSWPGNIRELKNVVRRVLLTSERRIITRKSVSELLRTSGPVSHSGRDIDRDGDQVILRIPARETFNEIIDECERVVLIHALDECAWNKSKVTKVLKIPRQSLYNKIAKYNLQRTWGDSGE